MVKHWLASFQTLLSRVRVTATWGSISYVSPEIFVCFNMLGHFRCQAVLNFFYQVFAVAKRSGKQLFGIDTYRWDQTNEVFVCLCVCLHWFYFDYQQLKGSVFLSVSLVLSFSCSFNLCKCSLFCIALIVSSAKSSSSLSLRDFFFTVVVIYI